MNAEQIDQMAKITQVISVRDPDGFKYGCVTFGSHDIIVTCSKDGVEKSRMGSSVSDIGKYGATFIESLIIDCRILAGGRIPAQEAQEA